MISRNPEGGLTGHSPIGGRASWTVDDGRLRLRWSERGGPLVVAPLRQGVGTLMIEKALRAQLRGDVRLDYCPTGLTCAIDAPLDAIREI